MPAVESVLSCTHCSLLDCESLGFLEFSLQKLIIDDYGRYKLEQQASQGLLYRVDITYIIA